MIAWTVEAEINGRPVQPFVVTTARDERPAGVRAAHHALVDAAEGMPDKVTLEVLGLERIGVVWRGE